MFRLRYGPSGAARHGRTQHTLPSFERPASSGFRAANCVRRSRSVAKTMGFERIESSEVEIFERHVASGTEKVVHFGRWLEI